MYKHAWQDIHNQNFNVLDFVFYLYIISFELNQTTEGPDFCQKKPYQVNKLQSI